MGLKPLKSCMITIKTLPIIVVTASTSDSDLARAKACGAIGHIHKPIDQQSIIAALNNAFLPEVD